ncbi:hypothetical protein HZP71_06345 [Elizabethkingia anophelis]|nr:hypothetical protein [Elizabethkingia anophelis]
MPSYQSTIDLHKAQVQETIEKLAEKGIDVTEIEYQTKTTENKITELDKKLDKLPDIKKDLIVQYKKEKDESLKLNQNVDSVGERREENLRLFTITDRVVTSDDSIKSDQINDDSTWNLQYEGRNSNSIPRKR